MTANIIQGDCLEVMRTMPDGSFDMVFTSPPFKEEDVDGDYWKLYGFWMHEMLRVASKLAIVIHSATKINQIMAGWPPKRTMIWGKGFSQYSWRWNPIFIYQKSDDYKVNKFIWGDAFAVQSVNGNGKQHKYQDPVLLYETVIKMFKGCQSVLDPFCGSGTTGIVCQKLGFDFTGIDINPAYIEVTKQRKSTTEFVVIIN
jgi:DNA modification methylase